MRRLLVALLLMLPVAAFAQSQQQLDATANMIMSDLHSQVPNGECSQAEVSPCKTLGLLPITLQPGDVVLQGSLPPDKNGNVWSLQPGPCQNNGTGTWWSGVYLNGQQIMCGYAVSLRMVNGDAWYQEAKGSGYKDLTLALAQNNLNSGMDGPYVVDPGQGTGGGVAAEAASTSSGASSSTSQQPIDCPGLTFPRASGAVTPGSGSFTANGVTYSIDANNGDVASANGQPINDGAYQTSQLAQGSDGQIYGQDENSGGWFRLDGGGGDTWWTPLGAMPSALASGSGTVASGSSSDTTAMNRVASAVCPQLTDIQGQIDQVNQQAAQIQAALTQQAQSAISNAPTDFRSGELMQLPPDNSSSGGSDGGDGGGGDAQ